MNSTNFQSSLHQTVHNSSVRAEVLQTKEEGLEAVISQKIQRNRELADQFSPNNQERKPFQKSLISEEQLSPSDDKSTLFGKRYPNKKPSFIVLDEKVIEGNCIPTENVESSPVMKESTIVSPKELRVRFDTENAEIPEEIFNGSDRPFNRMAGTRGGITIDDEFQRQNIIENQGFDPLDGQILDSDPRPNRVPPDTTISVMTSIQNPRRRSTRNLGRRSVNRYRNQQAGTLSNTRTLGMSQIDDMTFDAWDMDVIHTSEDLQLDLVIASQVNQRYRRRVGLLALKFIFILLIYLVSIEAFPFQVVSLLIAMLETLIAVYVVSKLTKADFRNRKRRWRVFVFLDWILFVQFAICLTLKLEGIMTSRLAFNTIPGSLSIIPYLTFAEPPVKMRTPMVITRGIVWTQLLLISLRIDGNIEMSWRIAFLLIWVGVVTLLIATGVCWVLFGFLLYNALKGRREMRNMPMRWQIFGVGSHVANLSLSIIMTIFLVSFTKYMDLESDNKTLMQGSSLAAAIYSLINCCFTLKYRSKFKEFFKSELLNHSGRRQSQGQRVVTFKSEDLEKPTLFATISSTYFLAFDQAILVSKQDLLKLKTSITNLKRGKNNIKSNSIGSDRGLVTKLNEWSKIKRVPKTYSSGAKNKSYLFQLPHQGLDLEQGPNEIEKLKLGLSMDNKDKINDLKEIRKTILKAEEVEEDGENLCFICYTRRANTIFLCCGHGGVCYECAKETWTKRNTCITCRNKIRELAQLTPIKGMNMAKAVNMTRRMIEVVRPQDNNLTGAVNR